MSAEDVITEAIRASSTREMPDGYKSIIMHSDQEYARVALAALKAGGYAVVELPKSSGVDDDGQEWFGDGDIRVDHTARDGEYPNLYLGSLPYEPNDLRREAADMLAAANAAEVA